MGGVTQYSWAISKMQALEIMLPVKPVRGFNKLIHISAFCRLPTQTQEWSRVEFHCAAGFEYAVTSSPDHVRYSVFSVDTYQALVIMTLESHHL